MNKDNEQILLSVIVLCFNEIKTLDKVINDIQSSPVESKEIIIVDDFSSDGSREFLKKVESYNIKTIFHDFLMLSLAKNTFYCKYYMILNIRIFH